MGIALAEAAARRGADVTLIAANVALPSAAGVSRIDINSAAELDAAARAEFGDADLLLMAAAVADFRPAEPYAGKLVREQGAGLSLDLEPTADVIAGLAGRAPGRPGAGRLRCRARRRFRRAGP